MTDMILSKGTPTNFELAIPILPSMVSLEEVDQLVLHLHEAVLPSMTIDTIPRYWQGIKIDEQPGHAINYEDWNISFTVDAQLTNWMVIYEWMMYITTALADGQEHHLPRQYTINASLLATDNYKNPCFNVTFIGVWPATLGEVRFANRDGENILESTATLKYEYYNIERMTS